MKNMILILALLALVLTGCAEKAEKCLVSKPISYSSTSVEQGMWAAKSVLSRMNFRIDKFDIENGYLRTRPLPACQFIAACGNSDVNVGAFNKAESSLHSLTRTVEMEFTLEGSSLCIDCRACIRRLSMEEKEISSISQTAAIFSKSSRREQRLLLDAKPSELEWVNLGRDAKLENKIHSLLECNIKADQN